MPSFRAPWTTPKLLGHRDINRHDRVARFMVKTLQFLAVILLALSVVPGGAHLLALRNKIDLPSEQYFIVQGIYRGWALVGIVMVLALLANAAAAVVLRRSTAAFSLSLAATACIVAALIVFFVWTCPANQATSNWTVVPANWRALRTQWEYAHAAGAVLTFAGLCCTVLSTLATPR